MRTGPYFTLLLIILVELIVLLLQLERLSGVTFGVEAIIAVGFVFLSLILLIGYRAEWRFIAILGVLFFCFNLLNFLVLYFMLRGVIMLFVGEVATIVGLVMAVEHRPRRKIPKGPKVEIIKEEKKAEKRKPMKYIGSKYGKTYHRRGCTAAKKIERKNRVYFFNKEEADKLKYKAHKCVK